MVKKAKKKSRKKLTPLKKIKKELGKLEALHEKENAIVENINEIIEDHEDDLLEINMPEYSDRWEGTD